MKCKTKKIISVAVSAAIAVTSVCVQDIHSQAAGGGIAHNSTSSGTYGDAGTIDYLYYKGNSAAESFLILEGNGKMPDMSDSIYNDNSYQDLFDAQGWYESCLDISKEDIDWYGQYYENLSEIVVGGEISTVGTYTFCNQMEVSTIRLGKSVTVLSEQAISNSSWKNIYIYGNLDFEASDFNLNAFEAIGTYSSNPTIHVTTEEIKNKIESYINSDESYCGKVNVVNDLTVDDTPLRIAMKKGLIQQNMHADGAGYSLKSWAELTAVMKAGQDLLDAEDKTEDAIAAQAAAIDEAIAGLVSTDVLDQAIADAEKLSSMDYTSSTWQKLQEAVEAGKTGLEKVETEDEIAELASAITNAIDELVPLTPDTAKAELEEVIAQIAELVESDYSESSWTTLQDALKEAESVSSSSTIISELTDAKSALQKAMDALVVEYPTEWYTLAGIRYKQTSTILSGKVDSEMAGATKVEVTFDCTAETEYNPYASIDLAFNGAYQQFKGTDSSYTKGSKGWKETLELDSALKEGTQYTLEGSTWAWEQVTGDVYTIQSVKFYDADGNLLKSVDAPDGIGEILGNAAKTAEEEAAALTADDYTEESLDALNQYIASIKNMENADELLPSEVNKILADLEDVTSMLVPSDNTAALEMLSASIQQAEALDKSEYTADSWKAVETALTAAKNASESTMKSEIAALNQALSDAMAALKKTENPGQTANPDQTENPGQTANPDQTENPGQTKNPDQTANPGQTAAPGGTTNPGPSTGGSINTEPTKAPSTVKKPGKATIKKVTAKKSTVTVKLKKKVAGVTSYQVVVSNSKKFKKTSKVTVKNVKKLKFTVKYKKLKMKKGKKYYIKIRAVKKSGSKNLYGKYSAVKKFTAK